MPSYVPRFLLQQWIPAVARLREAALATFGWANGRMKRMPPRSCATVTTRPFCEADLADFYEWASDDAVTRFTTWETYRTVEKAREFLLNVAIPHPWFRAICMDGKPVGHVVLKQGTGVHRCRAEMGYATARKYWGLGIATQAVIQEVQIAFGELPGLQRIEALVLPDNVASQRVLRKAGFHQEGLLRNYVHLKGSVHDCLIFSYVLPASPGPTHSRSEYSPQILGRRFWSWLEKIAWPTFRRVLTGAGKLSGTWRIMKQSSHAQCVLFSRRGGAGQPRA